MFLSDRSSPCANKLQQQYLSKGCLMQRSQINCLCREAFSLHCNEYKHRKKMFLETTSFMGTTVNEVNMVAAILSMILIPSATLHRLCSYVLGVFRADTKKGEKLLLSRSEM